MWLDMKIQNFSYVGSYGHGRDLPKDGKLEVAFYGRSNVGKSTILNTLLGVRNVAFASKTPGRTGNANYFLINNQFYFVDMPGYGYAKVSKKERVRWLTLQKEFLERPGNPAGVVLILDSRHTPSDQDREMMVRILGAEKRFCLVFNKIDKLTRGVVSRQISKHLQSLEASGGIGLVPFSSVTKAGKRELLAWIAETIAAE
jgi:GTP-binding protein